MHCPINNTVENNTDKCKNCIAELADRVFRRKIAGGKIEAPQTWCDDVRDIGLFLDKVVARNQECYDTIKMIISSPVEVRGLTRHSVEIEPGLWQRAIDVVNGGFK